MQEGFWLFVPRQQNNLVSNEDIAWWVYHKVPSDNDTIGSIAAVASAALADGLVQIKGKWYRDDAGDSKEH